MKVVPFPRFSTVVCLLLASLAWSPAGLAQARDTVIVGMAGDPDNIIPGFSRLAPSGHISNMIFVGLTGLNADWQVYPRLSAEVPTVENGQWKLLSGGGMEVTFRLRAGFKWHDGTPVTAADVVFGWEVQRTPAGGAEPPDPGIAAVTAPDASTLVVRWNQLRYGANLYATEALPRHLLEASFRQNPGSIRSGAFAERPVGNGPYRLVEWVRGREMRFQAVEDYPEGRPAIPNLIIRFFPNAEAAAGTELHVDFLGRGGAPLVPSEIPGLTFEHIALNLDVPALRDRRVRQALALAIDREAVLRQVARGELAHTWLPPRHPNANPSVRQYRYDPEAAKRLLAEAGWTPGPDGIMRNQAGERLELVFTTNAGNPIRARAQDLFRAQWQAVGVAVRTETQQDFFNRLARRQFEMGQFGWVLAPWSNGYDIWHSSRIPSSAGNFQGANYYGWRNQDNDQLLDQVGRELNDARRTELMRRQQEVWAEQLPAIPLWFPASAAFVHPNLQGVRPTGTAGGFFWNVHQWAWK